jgi:hypothetical protein
MQDGSSALTGSHPRSRMMEKLQMNAAETDKNRYVPI